MGNSIDETVKTLNRKLRVRGPLPENVLEASFTHPRSLSPYFRNAWKAGVSCPECGSRKIQMRPTLNPDAAYLECRCGYLQVVVAPLKSSPEAAERWKADNQRAGQVVAFRSL